MAIQDEIDRIRTDRDSIRNKLIELGLATSTADLDVCATAVVGIKDNGNINAEVQEGDTFTIPKGYHNGSGTVTGVAGGGNYKLQSKTWTPTKASKSLTPDQGFYGLSDVTVSAIPDNYQDISGVTATAPDVLANKVIVGANGKVVAGTMPNNGAVSKTLSAASPTYDVPAGYHSGLGSVKIIPETKAATPTKLIQQIEPTKGKVLSKVTVNPIPAEYITTTDADALAGEILAGKTAYVAGDKVEGTMPNNVARHTVLDVATTSFTIPAGYHSGKGDVSVSLEAKTVEPTRDVQTVTPTLGNVLSSVTVGKIPDKLIDTTGANALAANILAGKTAYVGGKLVTGSMKNNGLTGGVITGLGVDSYVIPAGYTTGGSVTLSNDIETALAEI